MMYYDVIIYCDVMHQYIYVVIYIFVPSINLRLYNTLECLMCGKLSLVHVTYIISACC